MGIKFIFNLIFRISRRPSITPTRPSTAGATIRENPMAAEWDRHINKFSTVSTRNDSQSYSFFHESESLNKSEDGSSAMTHGTSIVYAGNVARGLRRRNKNIKTEPNMSQVILVFLN